MFRLICEPTSSVLLRLLVAGEDPILKKRKIDNVMFEERKKDNVMFEEKKIM